MSQSDYNVANADGATVRAKLNEIFGAIVGANNGSSEPTTTFAYMLWLDTSTSLLKMRDGTNSVWLTVLEVNSATIDVQGLSGISSDVASGATADIGAATTPMVRITGTTGISSFGSRANCFRVILFADALTLTNSSALILPGGVDITTAAGDWAIAVSDASANWSVIGFFPAAGAPINEAEASVASAATCDIGAASSPRVAITGTTTITSFGTKPNRLRFVRFAGALTLTYNATSLILPGQANIVTSAGDYAVAESDASGNWTIIGYFPISAAPANQVEVSIASATTCDIGASASERVSITGTTTITSFGSKPNRRRYVRFTGILTLTYDGTALILPGGASLTTAAGDTCTAISDNSGNWRVYDYRPALASVEAQPEATIASASTVDLGSVNTERVAISGTTTITSFGTGARQRKIVRFTGILTLTYNATSLILPTAASITTAAGDVGIFTSDSSGNWRCASYLKADGTAIAATSSASVFPGALYGLTLANNSTQKIDVAAGSCADSTGAKLITVAATKTVDFTTTGANALDTGAIASSTWYHIFAIMKADGTVGVLGSTSPSSPTLPSGYTYFRRIGSAMTDGSSHFLSFTQVGDTFYLATQILDVNAGTFSATASLVTLTTPLGVKCEPLIRAASSAKIGIFTSPDETDVAPSAAGLTWGAAPGWDLNGSTSVNFASAFTGRLLTNTSSQIRVRGTAASAELQIVTRGWVDTRGKQYLP